MSKQEATLFRVYVTSLEYDKKMSSIKDLEIINLKSLISINKEEINNYKSAIGYCNSAVNGYEKQLKSLQETQKKNLRKEKRKGFFNGIGYGLAGGVVICLLLM